MDGQSQKAARGFGLLVANLTKLGGLVIAMNEGLFHVSDPNLPVVLAVAAFMLSGAQGLETLLDRLLPPGK